MPRSVSKQYWRIRKEAAFNTANPETPLDDWNVAQDNLGYYDMPVIRQADGLQPKVTVIYPATAGGKRSMNAAFPIAGAETGELGTLELIGYPDLWDPILYAIMGSKTPTETPGTAALVATATPLAALALDTEPTSTEQLQFIIASSTDATSFVIEIYENAILQESIAIPDNIGTIDGTYYSKGGYIAPVTITTTGTATASTLAVAGIASTSTVYQVADGPVFNVIEQGERVEAGAIGTSEFFPGCFFPTLELTFDRSAADGLLTGTLTIMGVNPTNGTGSGFGDEAAEFYVPFTAWNAKFQIADADWCEVQTATITIQPNSEAYAVACGQQEISGGVDGYFEVFGTLTILPTSNVRWTDYLGVTDLDMTLEFTSAEFVNGATPYSLKLDMPSTTIEDYSRSTSSMIQTAEMAIRAVHASEINAAIEITKVGRTPK